MHRYGIRGTIHSWFKDYLTDRNQRVVINGVKSSIKTSTLGVPQGGVLSLLLFVIYISDISDSLVDSKTILFADDMTMYIRIWLALLQNNSSILQTTNLGICITGA